MFFRKRFPTKKAIRHTRSQAYLIQSVGLWGEIVIFGKHTSEIIAVVKPAIVRNLHNGEIGMLQQSACALQTKPLKIGNRGRLIIGLEAPVQMPDRNIRFDRDFLQR